MVKCFSKKYGNKGRAFNKVQSESYVKIACQHLMLHPYITASRTIVNILLSLVEFKRWTLRGLPKGDLLLLSIQQW